MPTRYLRSPDGGFVPYSGGGGTGGGSDVELIAMIEGDGECTVIEKTADVSEDGVYMLSLKFDANLETNGTTNYIGVYVGASSMYTSVMSVIQDANANNAVTRRGGVTFVIKDKRGYVAGSAHYSIPGIANVCEASKELSSNEKKLIVQSNSGATVPVGVRVYLFKLK